MKAHHTYFPTFTFVAFHGGLLLRNSSRNCKKLVLAEYDRLERGEESDPSDSWRYMMLNYAHPTYGDGVGNSGNMPSCDGNDGSPVKYETLMDMSDCWNKHDTDDAAADFGVRGDLRISLKFIDYLVRVVQTSVNADIDGIVENVMSTVNAGTSTMKYMKAMHNFIKVSLWDNYEDIVSLCTPAEASLLNETNNIGRLAHRLVDDGNWAAFVIAFNTFLDQLVELLVWVRLCNYNIDHLEFDVSTIGSKHDFDKEEDYRFDDIESNRCVVVFPAVKRKYVGYKNIISRAMCQSAS